VMCASSRMVTVLHVPVSEKAPLMRINRRLAGEGCPGRR
jgi:hypothetical protein